MRGRDIKKGFFALVKEDDDLEKAKVIVQSKNKLECILGSRYYWFRKRVCVIQKTDKGLQKVWDMNSSATKSKEERESGNDKEQKGHRSEDRGAEKAS